MSELDNKEDCDHWWKHMGVVKSAYFTYPSSEDYIKVSVSECKMCSKWKTELVEMD